MYKTSIADKGGHQISVAERALASDLFDKFCNATTLKQTLGYHRQLCEVIHLKPSHFSHFYPKLKQYVDSWRAKALWKKFDARASHKCYAKGKACNNTRVLIIGGGPCGLRTAIEAQLLGAKVVVVEKRDRISRNNVLHLWPFVIEDLRALGAKKFFGKFCAGAIDHISIRQLQCILIKVALLLGVEIHTEVSFVKLLSPPSNEESKERIGWRGMFNPPDHPVSQYEFDVLIGADGRRNTLEGFKRKEFRGRLAIAVTANFINKRTEAEARVEEISGVAFIFNQKFFKDLYEETGIDLENIVYYKDDTHYFVMTAKKQSLLDKGVIINDIADTSKLLARENVDVEALQNYAREAAEFSTQYQMQDLEFAVNHYGNADVTMFDFTSMYAAENASKVIERNGFRLLMTLVGDSLLEPFWPTGSGCARGFLSSLDACWAIRGWGSGTMNPLEVLAERESIYRLLGQTTPENLQRDSKSYTLDPSTRYPNLNKSSLLPIQVKTLYDTDDPTSVHLMTTPTAATNIHELHKKRRRKDSQVHPDTLLHWLKRQVVQHENLHVDDLTTSFKDGMILCAIINRYRPDLLDYQTLKKEDIVYNNQVAFDILEKELGILPVMTGQEMAQSEIPDFLSMWSYLTRIYDTFRGEIPHIKHPKLYVVCNPNLTQHSSEIPSKDFPVNQKKSNSEGALTLYKEKKKDQITTRSDGSISTTLSNKSSTEENLNLLLDVNWKPKVIPMYINKNDGLNPLVKVKKIRKLKQQSYVQKVDKSNDDLGSGKELKELYRRKNIKHKTGIKLPVIINEKFDTKNSENMVKNDENSSETSRMTEVEEIIVEDAEVPEIATRVGEGAGDQAKPVVNFTMHTVFYDANYSSSYCRESNTKHLKPKLVTPKLGVSEEELIRKLEKEIFCSDSLENNENSTTLTQQRISVENFIRKLLEEEQRLLRKDAKLNIKNVDQENKSSTVEKQTISNQNELNPEKENIAGKKKGTKLHLSSSAEIVRPKSEINMDFPKKNFVKCNSKNDKVYNYDKPTDSKSKSPKSMNGEFSTGTESIKLKYISQSLQNLLSVKDILKLEAAIFAHQLQNKYVTPLKKDKDLQEIKKVERPMQVCVMPLRDNNGVNKPSTAITNVPPPRAPTYRQRRHVEIPTGLNTGINPPERKNRKRRNVDKEERTKRLEEIATNRTERMSRRKQQRRMQTEQFIKSMQMLHANAKMNEGIPFEDYSIFLYRQTAPNFEDRVKELENKLLYPDREVKMPGSSGRGEKDEEFSGRIKDFEDKLREQFPQEKKPKDLLRAIGKIETTDWNVKEIEKKIIENKMGKAVSKEKERVPKWSREQFLARQTKIEKRGLEKQDSEDKKFATIDKTLKQLDQKLKEGTVRQLGTNKVSAITEQFKKVPETDSKPIHKSNSKVIVPTAGGSENCHFCSKRVYLMERLSAEGRFFHRGCFRCQYCNTMLRLGTYMFDKDGKYGHKFYCSQHFGMQGQLKGQKVVRKSAGKTIRNGDKSPEKVAVVSDVTVLDLVDRVQTPERIEFSNMSGGISEHEESFSQMDEDEWTDRNFGASTAELGSSDDDDSSSDSSGSESDDDEVFEEALDEPLTKEGTQRLVERWSKRYSKDREGDDESSPEDYDTGSDLMSYENSSDDDDSDTATEGEEEIRARELRKQEVRVEPPIVQHTDTGSDTEIASDEEDSISSSGKENSATEITTDSEFDHDDTTPTREIPSILLNDMNVSKHRGNYQTPKKVQVKSGELQRPLNSKKTGNIELKMTQLPSPPVTVQKVPSPDITSVKPSPLINPRKGDYLLNRTQSTGGIATKISLELKKKYLLDTVGLGGNIQRSGSATTLDSKLKSFHSNISEHQKLLNPAPEISPTMQAFLHGTSKIHTPLSPSITPKSPTFCIADNKFDQSANKKVDEKVDEKLDEKSEILHKSPEIIDLTLSPNEEFAMQPDITKNLILNEELKEKKCDLPKLIVEDTQPDVIYTNDTEGRPRSPVHETSIIVPEISWNELNKHEKKTETDIDTDSLSSESEKESEKSVSKNNNNKVFSDIPRVEVHDYSEELAVQQDEDIMMDSLCIVSEKANAESKVVLQSSPLSSSDVPKSILSEKKTLNQPKVLPLIENTCELKKCHNEIKDEGKEEKTEVRNSSGRSSPVSISEHGNTGALTDTELSDWARDGTVSDNLEDVEFDMDPVKSHRKQNKCHKKKSIPRSDARIAMIEDFEDSGHVCGKDKNITSLNRMPSSQNGVPIADFDSIEYMDTGSEVSIEDFVVQTANTTLLKNRGYVQFVSEQEQEIKPKTQDIPNNNEIIVVEAVNENFNVALGDQNTGYCVFGNEDENVVGNFGGKVIDLKLSDLEELKQNNQIACDNEDDSLINIDTGTTTEENTVSDSTVKNLNNEPVEQLPKDTDDNLVVVLQDNENKNDEVVAVITTPVIEEQTGVEYDEHVKRLQLKYAEFGFVRDSIDIRKSKRKSKSQSPPSHSENVDVREVISPVDNTVTITSPITSKKIDEIHKERNKQKDLIHDLVMDKVRTQRRSLDKKRKIRDSFSPSYSPVRSNFDLAKSATVASVLAENNNSKNVLSVGSDFTKPADEKTFVPLQKSPTVTGVVGKENSQLTEKIRSLTNSHSLDTDDLISPKKEISLKPYIRPLSVNENYIGRSKPLAESSLLPDTPLTNPEAFSLPDIHQIASVEEFKTPIAPPRTKNDEAKRTAEKLKQNAKVRARLMSDEELGLSPEDKINVHRQKLLRSASKKSIEECIQDSIETLVLNTEKRNAMLFNDTLAKKKQPNKLIVEGELLQNSVSSVDISNKLYIFSDDHLELERRNRTKSVSEIPNVVSEKSKSFCNAKSLDLTDEELKKTLSINVINRSDSQKKQQFYKSDPNLLMDTVKKDKKSKDRERRKSIIKSVADFFQKKKDVKSDNVKPSTTSASVSVKDRFARFRISPKSKEKSKERNSEPQVRRKSLEEQSVKGDSSPTPPPIPPPPLNYVASNTRDDTGSEGESEWKRLNNSNDTLDKSCTLDGSSSIGGRRISRSMRKATRQAQIKRHRQAQEIQRKLEETEVKTRELEERGVVIEKVFRGEVTSAVSDETELLREWFKLMQDRTELRRYEKELLLRAQELEYEDRHARLQQELRERLTMDDENKTEEDVAAEGAILSEMLEIVAKRDSLIALLEEDRQRYHEEDRDFEAQMLAKGLMLTSVKKTSD